MIGHNPALRSADLAILDAATGAVLHTVREVDATALAVDAARGHVVGLGLSVGSNGGPASVSTFETRSGRTIRSLTVVQTDAPDFGALAVDARRHRAAVATWEEGQPWSQVSAIDTRSGRLLRQVRVVGTGRPIVAVDEQTARIFVAHNTFSDEGNTVSVFDATRL